MTKGGGMKKLLILSLLGIIFIGCGLIPNEKEIRKLLEEDLIVTMEPDDKGVVITIEGMPDKLPNGLDGINVYLSDQDISGKSEEELGTPIATGITSDTVIENWELTNGTRYFVEGRADIGGQITTYGFGGRFYPRPWGYGDYLGYDPGTHEDGNAIFFTRETGEPVAGRDDDPAIDFYFYREGTDIYIMKPAANPTGGIVASGKTKEEWLDVQDAPSTYGEKVKLEKDMIYQFMTDDSYYGKFAIEGIKDTTVTTPVGLAGEVAALKVDLRYAFQTAKEIGHY